MDTTSVVDRLPHSILAFFFLPSTAPDEIERIRAAHHMFAQEFKMSKQQAPPLLLLDLARVEVAGVNSSLHQDSDSDTLTDVMRHSSGSIRPKPISIPLDSWFANDVV